MFTAEDLNSVFMTPASTGKLLSKGQHETIGIMRKFGYTPVFVAGRAHYYTADAYAAKAKLDAGAVLPQEQDPIAERKNLEASYGVPANQQFTVLSK